MKNKQKYLKIGELSKQSGLAVSAIRYYEELGLIEPSFRNESKYRYYTETDVSLLNFIKKSKHLGFSLDEIKAIITERSQGKLPCHLVKDIANKKITEIEDKIYELQALKSEIKKHIIENPLPNSTEEDKICELIDEVEL